LEWVDGKEEIRIRVQMLGIWGDWTTTKIIKLKNKELWTIDTYAGIETEIHYVTAE